MGGLKLDISQYNFTAGEISPEAFGRLDSELSASGLAKARNVYIDPRGGCVRREGLSYIDRLVSDQRGRLIPFSFSTIQSYLLVFTPGQFTVYKDDVAQTIVNTSPISTLTADIISEMTFTQSADTLILFHNSIPNIAITRTSHTSWTAANITYSNAPAYAFGGVTVTEPISKITPDRTSGRDITLTSSLSVFTSAYVGQYIALKKGGLLFVTEFVSSSEIKADARVDLPDTAQVHENEWELESGYEDVWSATRGYPSVGVFYQGRLWLANSTQRPQTIWGSNVGDFYNFDLDNASDSAAIDVTIDDDRVNSILGLFPGRNLQVYTTGGEYYIPLSENTPITPTNITLYKSTQHGSKKVSPVSADGATFFLEASGSVLREFVFNQNEQSYVANNVSLLSSSIINSPTSMVSRSSTSGSPATYVYLVNSDGTIAVLNISRDKQLFAWSLFTTLGEVEQITNVSGEVYVIVKRTINGSDRRFIEKLDSNNFTDSSIVQTSVTPTTSWSNLAHLEGESVKIRANNYILPEETVSSGSVTVSEEVNTLEVGLNFLASIESLPLDKITQRPTELLGEHKRLVKVMLRLYLSRNIKVVVGDKTYKPFFRQFGNDVLDSPAENFTGWKQIFLTGEARDAQIEVTQDEPLEFNVLSWKVTIK